MKERTKSVLEWERRWDEAKGGQVNMAELYPRPLMSITPDPFSIVARVDKNGFIKWHQRNVFISSALRHEYIELDANDAGHWDVRWGPIPLGRLDERRPGRGLVVTRRPRGFKKVSGMSLV